MSGPHDRNMVRTRAHRLGRAGAWLLAGAGVVVIIVAVLLALPVEQWRTGKRFENTLSTLPEAALPQPAQRIWIDSDPACGVGRRVDADDCLAIRNWPPDTPTKNSIRRISAPQQGGRSWRSLLGTDEPEQLVQTIRSAQAQLRATTTHTTA
jgi:hypothetical protein